MPLQDVSNDQLMINWLRQAGHGHLIDDRNAAAAAAGAAAPSSPPDTSYGQPAPSPNYPPLPSSSSLSQFDHGLRGNDLHRSGSYPQGNFNPMSIFGGNASPPPPMIPPPNNPYPSSYNQQQQQSPVHFASSPTQFLARSNNDQQLDADIEVSGGGEDLLNTRRLFSHRICAVIRTRASFNVNQRKMSFTSNA